VYPCERGLAPGEYEMSAYDTADNENEQRVINEFLEELRDTASQLQVLLGNMRSHSVPVPDGCTPLPLTSFPQVKWPDPFSLYGSP